MGPPGRVSGSPGGVVARDRARVAPAAEGPGTRGLVLGLVAAVAVLVGLAGLFLLSVRPFASGDESAHADYAVALVGEGRLPTLFDVVEPRFEHQSDKPQHVANHPPLYYAVTGVPLVAGLETGHPLAGYLLARSWSLVAGAGAVLAVAGLAHALTRRRDVALAAAVLTASYRPLVDVAAVLHNDTTSLLATAAVLWLVVLVVLRGPTRRRLVLLTVLSAAGVLVRAENAAVTGVAALAVLAATVLWAPTDRTSAVVRGVLRAAVLGLCSLAAVGWFWWRSVRLYGNPLGYGVLEPQFGRAETPTASLWLFRRPDLLLAQLGLPSTRSYGDPSAWLTVLPFAVVVLALGWLVLARVLGRPGRVPVSRPVAASTAPWAPSARPRWVVLAVLVSLHAAVTVAMVLRHVDAGGGARVRYLFPLLPVVACAAAVALLRLPGGRRGGWVLLVAGAAALVSLGSVGTAAWRWWQVERLNGPVVEGLERGVTLMGSAASGHPVLVTWVGLLLVAGGLVATGAALHRLTRPPKA